MKTRNAAALAAALGLLSMLPAGAQTLTHRYNFNGNANDSVGTANGTAVGNVTFNTSSSTAGSAVFAGGSTNTNPGEINLPTSAVSGLTNATIEIFTSAYNGGGDYQSFFGLASAPGNMADYVLLNPNRGAGGNAGLGFATKAGTNTGGGGDQSFGSQTNYPTGLATHAVDYVFSGFNAAGTSGTVTVYQDGTQVLLATGVTNSFLSVFTTATANNAGPVLEIGGGSPYNDPTFQGTMTNLRIFNGALTASQVAADFAAGPNTVAAAPEPSQFAGLGLGAFGLVGLAFKARKRRSA